MGLFRASIKREIMPAHFTAQYPLPIPALSRHKWHSASSAKALSCATPLSKTLMAMCSNGGTRDSEDAEFYSLSDGMASPSKSDGSVLALPGIKDEKDQEDLFWVPDEALLPALDMQQLILDSQPEAPAMVREATVPPLIEKKSALLDSTVRILQDHFDKLQQEYHTVLQQQEDNERDLELMLNKLDQSSFRIDKHDVSLSSLDQSRLELVHELSNLRKTVTECQSEIYKLDQAQLTTDNRLCQLARIVDDSKRPPEIAAERSHRVIDLFKRSRPAYGVGPSRKGR